MSCPHCKSDNVEPIGQSQKLSKVVYYCVNCSKTFAIVTPKV